MKTIVVIGGGITGLTTMHYLQKLKREKSIDVKLILAEKNEYLGGKIHSVHKEEFIMETGADSIVARHESVMPLIKDLHLEDELVYNSTGISYLFINNELHPIPADTVFGIPLNVESLFQSTLVSEKGKQEALKDLESKNDHFTKKSSIGEFLEYFLGKELVEKQIAPVLSGVYSGNLNELSIASTLPYLLDYKNQYGSIIKGLSENREKFSSQADKKFISFKNGLSTLIDRLEAELTDSLILKGVNTSKITKGTGHYHITFSNHETIKADYVVLTTPQNVTQSLLNQNDLNDDFAKLTNSSLKSIYLGFDIPDGQLPADGTGFIVSNSNAVRCNACTWTSRKWSHTSKKNNLLVRLFYKSSNPSYCSLQQMNEIDLMQTALTDVEKSLGLKAKPTAVEITNWDQLMPNYHLNHNEAIRGLNEKMQSEFPNVILAGCSYFGVGIGACIKNGKETAEKIWETLLTR
ncbi:protoporphyrinogen oxidase [Halalkalibacter alkaliphilus]|uniref:Coproporphyrinogen III oxidase n=1 Tax=Halalkalibacter alkaliphilus TaxID=2917993 RepID=A0A9X2CWV8_9BACI|nr:protoporphyrinogen oxidase [Halalkalibacter alkaliphilus]MCL7749831.1 protoporphyrinogen oxidase [Halalkalibacter alkaliphilus]